MKPAGISGVVLIVVTPVERERTRFRPRHLPAAVYVAVFLLRAVVERMLGARSQETGDPRPWFEKPYLESALVGPVYERQSDPSPFTLDDYNSNVAFLRRVAEHQRGKDLVVYMSPLNKELMQKQVSMPGFIQNFARLDDFLARMAADFSFRYTDLTDAIPYRLFSDNLHLTPGGYQLLADVLWKEIRQPAQGGK